MPKTFLHKIFFNKKFKEIVVLYRRLIPLHPHDGCKWLHCHVETFEILDFYEAPPSHSNSFYILGNSFSFNSCFFFIVSETQFIQPCHDHRRFLVFVFEIILCLMLIFFLTSMFLVIYNLNSRDRLVARQLNFNYRFVRVQTQKKSAV